MSAGFILWLLALAFKPTRGIAVVIGLGYFTVGLLVLTVANT